MGSTHRRLQRFGVLVVVTHLLVSLAHGAAHSHLRLEMEAWQNIYILLVITLLPLVSALLLWRAATSGFLFLFASMLGSLIFGVYYHFVAAGADNVAAHGASAWGRAFLVTAVVLAVIEAAGSVTGVIGIWMKPQAIKKA